MEQCSSQTHLSNQKEQWFETTWIHFDLESHWTYQQPCKITLTLSISSENEGVQWENPDKTDARGNKALLQSHTSSLWLSSSETSIVLTSLRIGATVYQKLGRHEIGISRRSENIKQ